MTRETVESFHHGDTLPMVRFESGEMFFFPQSMHTHAVRRSFKVTLFRSTTEIQVEPDARAELSLPVFVFTTVFGGIKFFFPTSGNKGAF